MNEDLKAFHLFKESPLFIELAGISYCDANYYISRPDSDVAVIEYVLEGCGCVLYQGKSKIVTQDMIYFLLPHTHQEYYADATNPFKKIFLNVKGSLVEQLTHSYRLTDKNFFVCEHLKKVFEEIPKIIHTDLSEEMMQALLQGIFLSIISVLSFNESEGKYSKEAILLKSYIDSNIGKIIRLDFLSKMIYRSNDYTIKLFKKEFGTTPYSYQLNSKIRIAKNYLKNTNMPIAQIADGLGYRDAHYFTNIFKEKCGMCPLEYRKKSFEPK